MDRVAHLYVTGISFHCLQPIDTIPTEYKNCNDLKKITQKLHLHLHFYNLRCFEFTFKFEGHFTFCF